MSGGFKEQGEAVQASHRLAASALRSCLGRGMAAIDSRRELLTTNKDGLDDLRRQDTLEGVPGNGLRNRAGHQPRKAVQS